MGQEQSNLQSLEDAEDWEPPMLQDSDHKQLEAKARSVLRETDKDNKGSQPSPQPSTSEPTATSQQDAGKAAFKNSTAFFSTTKDAGKPRPTKTSLHSQL